MYNPYDSIQCSDADCEWIELYNDESSSVDLTNWTIDDKNFDSISISAGEYLVIARELIDGTDADMDSFETVWGNEDGIWDSNDGYNAVDGSLSLKNSEGDTIILKDNTGAVIESLTYLDNLANGNGKTLQLCDGSWIEEEATPGNINNCSIPEIQNETEQENTTEENNTTTEVDENNIPEPVQISSVNKIESEQEKTTQNENIEISVIKLTPKSIKSEENIETSNKNIYAIYGFVIFCILLIFLFLLKGKKFKNEFN